MALYQYRGIDKTGKEIKSTVTSEGISQAKQKVRSMGVMLIDIKEQTAQAQKQSTLITFGRSVSVNDLALMTRQLATLIKARIQVVDALSALMDQVDHATLRVVLAEVRQKVNEGSSLAKALSDHPRVFNTVYVNMVDAGEASGTLDVVLIRLADFTESQVKLKNKIRGAMTYPVIMAAFGTVMMNVIFIFVIPKIAKIFVSMKKDLPLQTKISIGISNFLQNYWAFVLAGACFTFYIIHKYLQTTPGKRRWHATLLKLPIVGILIKMINVSRFCSTLATLLNSGVPILTALSIVRNLIPNIHMKEAVEKSRLSVSEGASMTLPLQQSGHFPALVTHMIRLGEQSGELEPMLQIISENYEDQVESRLSGLTSILEPIMMIGLGVAVAFIVFSVVVPMMELNSVRR